MNKISRETERETGICAAVDSIYELHRQQEYGSSIHSPEVLLIGEEGGRYPDEEGRRCQQQLLGAVHTAGQQWYRGEHVLERVQHGH